MNKFLTGSLLMILSSSQIASYAASQQLATSVPKEASANTEEIPKQILKSGINLNANLLSPNALQLADTIRLTPTLERIKRLRAQVEENRGTATLESLNARQDLWEEIQKAELTIIKTGLDIDYTTSEINAEQVVYSEILSTYTNDRDKAIAKTNAISFISNGTLWAVCEALAIPGYRFSKYAIPSGIIGIPAGVVPSIASLYTFKQMSGKKRTSEVEPNMLAKLFGYPTNPEIEYPKSVWEFLNQIPASEQQNKSRRDQLVDRWIADANMPAFTDRKSKQQLDVITASASQRKGLSIATLTARQVMLEQLSAEIMKMKRLLLELTMAVQGDKQLTAATPAGKSLTPRISAGSTELY